MNARQVTAGIARPIGLFGVLVTALAVGTCRNTKDLQKPETEKKDPPVPTVSLGVPIVPSIILETDLSELPVVQEEPAINETPSETPSETTIPQVPIIPVMVEELRTFQEAMNTLDRYSARAVLDGKKVIFPSPKGFTKEDAEHIKERKFGLPPNGKLVNAESDSQPKPVAKKKSASFASVLSNVGKALGHPELTDEEENALSTIIQFLEKHGPVDCDFVDRMMKRLVICDGEQEEVEKVREKVYEGLIKGLERLGVKKSNE